MLMSRLLLPLSLVTLMTMMVSTPAHAVVGKGISTQAGSQEVDTITLRPYRFSWLDVPVTELEKPPVPETPEQAADVEEVTTQEANSAVIISKAIRTYNRRLSMTQVRQINSGLHHASRQYQLDPHLLASLIAVESSFQPRAISRTGAIGLGQLKPKTARWLGVNNPYNPTQNMYGAAKYLRYLLDRYNGSTYHALAAYYKGQGTIDRQGIDADAKYYVGKISKAYETITQSPLQ